VPALCWAFTARLHAFTPKDPLPLLRSRIRFEDFSSTETRADRGGSYAWRSQAGAGWYTLHSL
jgi:hypothetical protein